VSARARCPAGHDSTELDYCDVCGVAMGNAPAVGGGSAPQAGTSGKAGSLCPACTEPRADREARFCEVCRYDFLANKPGRAPAPAALVPPPPPAPPSPPTPLRAPAPASPDPVSPQAAAGAANPTQGAPSATTAYALVVQIDATLDVEPDASSPCPSGVADVVVIVDRADLLVGRRDEVRDVHPDIPVSDPGTSRRHGKFVRAVDGALAFLDLASTNGSKLNGVEVVPGSRSPLHPGDEITIGRWTRIRVTLP